MESLQIAVAVVMLLLEASGVFNTTPSTDASRGNRGAIVGLVVSDPQDEPIANAEVVLTSSGRTTRTDSSGRFRLESVATGNHVLSIRSVGFVAVDRTVAMSEEGADVEIKVRMVRAEVLDTMKVKATRVTIQSFEDNRRVGLGHFLTREDLAKRESSNLSDIIRTLPSVKVNQVGTHAWLAGGRGTKFIGKRNCDRRWRVWGVRAISIDATATLMSI